MFQLLVSVVVRVLEGVRSLPLRSLSLRCLPAKFLADVVRFPSGRRVAAETQLAEGGFSFVYRAYDFESGGQYALKKMICQDQEAKDAARAEAQVHERFSHESLLPLLDKAFYPHPAQPSWDVCWLLFPLCRCSLRDEITSQVLVTERPGLNWTLPRVLALLRGIGRGLQEMHRLRVAHRDVKPENILLRQGAADADPIGTPVVMDFGSCGDVEVPILGRRGAVLEMETAARLCTMQYRAPELFDMPSDVGTLSYAAADVWAFGCTGYCCLLGYSPFEVEFEQQLPCRPRQVDTSHLRILGPVPWPRAGPRSGTPEWLKDALRWILTANPAERPSMRQVLDSLCGAQGAAEDSV